MLARTLELLCACVCFSPEWVEIRKHAYLYVCRHVWEPSLHLGQCCYPICVCMSVCESMCVVRVDDMLTSVNGHHCVSLSLPLCFVPPPPCTLSPPFSTRLTTVLHRFLFVYWSSCSIATTSCSWVYKKVCANVFEHANIWILVIWRTSMLHVPENQDARTGWMYDTRYELVRQKRSQ